MTENQDVAQHPALLAAVTRECRNSILPVESPHRIGRYTCLMHVFEFTEKPEYLAIADYGIGRVFAGADFAHWLLGNNFLTEVPQANTAEGDLVVYFGEGHFKHVGLLRSNGRVISKWGIGHLYDHEVFEVPASYGSDVKFYARLVHEDAFELFTKFAEENGILFENADR